MADNRSRNPRQNVRSSGHDNRSGRQQRVFNNSNIGKQAEDFQGKYSKSRAGYSLEKESENRNYDKLERKGGPGGFFNRFGKWCEPPGAKSSNNYSSSSSERDFVSSSPGRGDYYHDKEEDNYSQSNHRENNQDSNHLKSRNKCSLNNAMAHLTLREENRSNDVETADNSSLRPSMQVTDGVKSQSEGWVISVSDDSGRSTGSSDAGTESSRDSSSNHNYWKDRAKGYRDAPRPRNEEEDEKMLQAAIEHSKQEYEKERAIRLEEDELLKKFLEGVEVERVISDNSNHSADVLDDQASSISQTPSESCSHGPVNATSAEHQEQLLFTFNQASNDANAQNIFSSQSEDTRLGVMMCSEAEKYLHRIDARNQATVDAAGMVGGNNAAAESCCKQQVFGRTWTAPICSTAKPSIVTPLSPKNQTGVIGGDLEARKRSNLMNAPIFKAMKHTGFFLDESDLATELRSVSGTASDDCAAVAGDATRKENNFSAVVDNSDNATGGNTSSSQAKENNSTSFDNSSLFVNLTTDLIGTGVKVSVAAPSTVASRAQQANYDASRCLTNHVKDADAKVLLQTDQDQRSLSTHGVSVAPPVYIFSKLQTNESLPVTKIGKQLSRPEYSDVSCAASHQRTEALMSKQTTYAKQHRPETAQPVADENPDHHLPAQCDNDQCRMECDVCHHHDTAENSRALRCECKHLATDQISDQASVASDESNKSLPVSKFVKPFPYLQYPQMMPYGPMPNPYPYPYGYHGMPPAGYYMQRGGMMPYPMMPMPGMMPMHGLTPMHGMTPMPGMASMPGMVPMPAMPMQVPGMMGPSMMIPPQVSSSSMHMQQHMMQQHMMQQHMMAAHTQLEMSRRQSADEDDGHSSSSGAEPAACSKCRHDNTCKDDKSVCDGTDDISSNTS